MLPDTTILYLTNNVLDPVIFDKVQQQLIKAADGIPIVSVSQKPMDLGTNICVGDIGSSWMNIYFQQLEGLKIIKTKYIAIAEHDVMYVPEHFRFVPPKEDVFYYNRRHHLVEWGSNRPEIWGMYSTWGRYRKALSQLICGRDVLEASIKERIELINGGIRVMRRLGEPGAFPPEVVKAAKIATSGQHCHTQSLLDHHLTTHTSDFFATEYSNLDIRHGLNFTGPRRGKNRCFTLPYWGEFRSIMES